MIIFSLFLLQVLPAAFCVDIEMQGEVKLANKYVAALKQPSQLVNLLLSYVPEKFLHTITSLYSRSNHNTPDTITDSPKSPQMKNFSNYLQLMGAEAINQTSIQILKDLNMEKNITSIVVITTDDYRNKLQNYYDFVKKYENDADRDLQYLDMVATSTRLLSEAEKQLLNDILMQENQNHNEKITIELIKSSYLFKRKVMKYLCITFNVCKEYPVTDYGAEIIDEIVKLDDVKFFTILKILYKIYKKNAKIISKFTKHEDRQLIMRKLQNSTHDLISTRVFFAFIRVTITQRFKPVKSDDEKFKKKIKAIRLLLDIFDKALNIDDDVMIIAIDNSLQDIRDWAAHKRDDIENILEKLAKNLIIRLKHNMTKTARKEMKSLFTVLVRKNTTKAFDSLLENGSNYLKDKDFHTNLDIMLND